MDDEIVRLLRKILKLQAVLVGLGVLVMLFWIFPELYGFVREYRGNTLIVIAICTIVPIIGRMLIAAATPEEK